ncbi:hypothetical protein Taro_027862 [Colocasia esculenta]|uniref:Uncharacterized protein n=1 Tax=Colocasia esculenta TaxID=4460 RepID=A0A843V9T6_COLES|nr:hypothetical protein [Colocasia esculenta]
MARGRRGVGYALDEGRRRGRMGSNPSDGGRLNMPWERGHRGLGHLLEQPERKSIVGKDSKLVHVDEGIMIRYKERRGLTRSP